MDQIHDWLLGMTRYSQKVKDELQSRLHHRRSIRLQGYDYSQPGMYFVTICTWQREPLFGEVVDGAMVVNAIGRIVEATWRNLPEYFNNTNLDKFVIMPNHFHGILHFDGSVVEEAGEQVGAKQVVSASPSAPNGTVTGSFSAIVQNFKAVSTRRINKFRSTPGSHVWQRNYITNG